MKALRYLGPFCLRLEQVPIPDMAPDGCLVRVRACGICGSDVHGYTGKTGRRVPPMTMGHEFSGEIVAVGREVSGFFPGDRVIPQPIQFCGECDWCRRGLTMLCRNRKFFGVMDVDGAMAEYISVPARYLYRMPPEVSFPVAAMAEPYAVAYSAVKKAGDLKGKRVLITGAGTIGLCLLQLVLAQEPELVMVSDLSETRLATARELGATATVDPGSQDFREAVAAVTHGAMMDVSFEAVGVSATANQSLDALGETGTAVWVGNNQPTVTVNMQDIVTRGKRILGTYTYAHEEFGQLVARLAALDAEKLISRVIPLEQGAEAFEALLKRPEDHIKIIIDPSQKEEVRL